MELLIPGLILVGLMVYASTRIKRSAARAFEAETVETDEFVIQKPDGFLNVLNGDPQFAFEAYSKDYGTGNDRDVRAATAKLRVLTGPSVAELAKGIRKTKVKVNSELSEVVGNIHYFVIDGARSKGDTAYRVLFKLAENGPKTYEFEVAALTSIPDTMEKAEALFDSFELKET
jgi:hypothetical protein